MTSGLILILVVAGAYLATHVAFEWLARRFQIVSGVEYLLLGILLGPQFAGLISPRAVDGFAPFLTLAIGWIGALVGAQFHVPQLMRIRELYYRVAFTEALLSFAVIAGVSEAVLMWRFDLTLEQALLPAVVLGAIGAVSAPSAIALVSRDAGMGQLTRQLQVSTAVDALVAVTIFGVALAVTHATPPGDVRPPTPTEWVVLSLAIGFGGGALFHLFVGPERKTDRLFISLAGALILTSGAAAYLSLSPLLPTMLVGMVLVNTSSSRDEIRKLLVMVERPLYFVLLIFAGATWEPLGRWVVTVATFVLVRVPAKVAAARLAARMTGALPALGPDWGRGLLGHGGLAIAVGLNFALYGAAPLANVVFTATVASVVLTDIFAVRLVRIVVSDDSTRGPGAGPATRAPSPQERA